MVKTEANSNKTQQVYLCPSLQECSWEGPATQLSDHVIKNHSELWSNEANYSCCIPISNNFQKNILILHSGYRFLLQLKTDLCLEQFWCGFRFIGDVQDVIKFKYEMNYRNASDHKQEKFGIMQLDDNWSFDSDLMMVFNLKSFKIQGDAFNVAFNIVGPGYNDFCISKLLFNELRCMVCRQPTGVPIFLCQTGHTICRHCKTKNNKCNYKRFKKCNLRLSNATRAVRYICENQKFKCNFVGTIERFNIHKLKCFVLSCLVVGGNECNWKGISSNFWRHIMKKHPESAYKYNKPIVYDFNAVSCKQSCFMSGFGEIFKISFEADHSKAAIMWSCQQTGLKSNADLLHRLRIEFVHPSNPNKRIFKFVDCTPLVEANQKVCEHEFVTFDTMKSFFVRSKIMLRILKP